MRASKKKRADAGSVQGSEVGLVVAETVQRCRRRLFCALRLVFLVFPHGPDNQADGEYCAGGSDGIERGWVGWQHCVSPYVESPVGLCFSQYNLSVLIMEALVNVAQSSVGEVSIDLRGRDGSVP